jgi:hypothetical protein
MKTQAIEWNERIAAPNSGTLNPAKKLNSATRLLNRSFLAAAPALALIVGAALLVSMPDLVVYLQAALWASGFVFFGLALDSEKPTLGLLNLATGIAVMALALLSSIFAIELLIVAVTIVAAWVATGILRQ